MISVAIGPPVSHVAVAGLAGITAGMGRTAHADDKKEVEAEAFIVKDKTGKVRAKLGSSEKGPGGSAA